MVGEAVRIVQQGGANRPDDGYRDYFRKSRPALLTGAAEPWPARAKWSPEYLRTVLGETSVPVGAAKSKHFRLDPLSSSLDVPRRTMPFGEYADHVANGPDASGWHYYLQRLPLADFCPGLLSDLPIPSFVDASRITSVNLWFSAHEHCTALHWDDYDNCVTQVYGSKRFVLFAPSQTQYLYPHSALSKAPHQSRVNIDAVDSREFDSFRFAERHEIILKEGDLLLLPACWWHQVYSIGTSISVNTWWRADLASLFSPNVAYMIRELSHARLLGSLRSYFARVEGANGSFMDVATQALGARQYWICMMLSLAAVEEHLMQQGKRCGLVSDKNIIGVEPLKLNDRLSRSGAQDAERSRRTDSLLATTLRMRDSPFEDVRREDAEYMMREANAVVGRPNRS